MNGSVKVVEVRLGLESAVEVDGMGALGVLEADRECKGSRNSSDARSPGP